MSYILDALRKAEVERDRQRQSVPGIHAAGNQQPIYLAYERNLNVAKWLGIATAAALAAGTSYFAVNHWMGASKTNGGSVATESSPPSPPAAGTGTQAGALPTSNTLNTPMAPNSPVPLEAPAVVERPPVVHLSTAAVSSVATRPAIVSQATSTTPLPKESSAVAPTKPANVNAPMAAPSPKLTGTAPVQTKDFPPAPPAPPTPPNVATGKSAGTAAAALPAQKPTNSKMVSTAIPLLNELPDHIRKQMPALSVAGAVLSESTKEWALLVNDQVLTPGSLVAPDLHLEEVSANSAVFNYRGQKFRLDR
jgi:general secretion pathway protein B